VGLLRRLNVTNDPKLEEARRDLEHALVNADTETIRDSDYVRETVKNKVDAIINKYSW